MKKFPKQVALTPVLFVLLTASAPFEPLPKSQTYVISKEVKMAQVSDPKEARKLKTALAKAERVIAKAERSIEAYKKAPESANERNQSSARRAIESAEKALSVISGQPESQPFEDRLKVVKSEFSAISDKNAEIAGDRESGLRKLEAMTASGEVERDADILDALKASIADPFRYTLDSAHYSRRGEKENLDAVVMETENWDVNVKAYEDMKRKYEALGEAAYHRARGVPSAIYHIRDYMPKTQENMKVFAADLPGEVDRSMNSAVNIAKEALDESRFAAFTGLNSEMRMALIKPLALTRVYEVLPNISARDAKAVRKAYEDGLERIETLKNKARDKIIAENRFDPDLYSGSDAAAIKKQAQDGFDAIHGKQKILEVRIPDAQWTRHQGWRWSKIDSAYSYFDYSTIDAFVFEQADKTTATFWRVTVQKRHLENDALIADPASRHRHKPTPDQQVLLSNL